MISFCWLRSRAGHDPIQKKLAITRYPCNVWSDIGRKKGRGDIGGRAQVGRSKRPRVSPGGSKLADAERQDLVRSHLPLVRATARRYATRSEDFDDLVQAGSLALVKASVRFDPSRGVAFSTFVSPAVEGAIRRQLSERSPGMELPGGDEVERAGTADPLAESDYRVLLAGGLRALDERERRIVVLRFHADMTERQIASEVGISQAHVSRLLDGALAKLRAGFASADRANGADTTESQAISPPKNDANAGKATKIADVGAQRKAVGDDVKKGNGQSPKTGFSGRFLVRMPSDLHEQLSLAAEREEISLNRYVTDALSTSVGKASPHSSSGNPVATDTGESSGGTHPRRLKIALATNAAVVVLAAVVAVVLLVLALQRGI